MNKLDENATQEDKILQLLPNGSGFNCAWRSRELKNGKLVFSSSFQCMNDTGYYDGYADFSVTLAPSRPLDFVLAFHGRASQYKSKRYQLREFIEDEIHWALR